MDVADPGWRDHALDARRIFARSVDAVAGAIDEVIAPARGDRLWVAELFELRCWEGRVTRPSPSCAGDADQQ